MKFHNIPAADFLLDGIPKCEHSHLLAKYFPDDKVNRDGWACDEFDQRGTINLQFLGDSWTQGAGVGAHAAYPAHVARLVAEAYGNVPVSNWNLAWGGRSNDFMARYGLCTFPQLRPDFVFLCFTSMDRREYFRVDGQKVLYLVDAAYVVARGERLSDHNIDDSNAEPIRHLGALSSPYDDAVNFLKDYKLLELSLNQLGIPWGFSMIGIDYVRAPIEEWMAAGWLSRDHYLGTPFLPVDKVSASDGHPGLESHRRFGQQVFDWMQDRYGARLASLVQNAG
jgi:hypothetical protein